MKGTLPYSLLLSTKSFQHPRVQNSEDKGHSPTSLKVSFSYPSPRRIEAKIFSLN
jgi:hypothetical protein